MKKFYSVFIVLLVMGSYSLFAEESPEKRWFFFNIEAGAASVSYTPETDAMLSDMESAGLDRMVVYLGIGAGYAVNEKLYAGAFISATGDRIEDSSNYMQINLYLYGAGLRYYPFTTGLVLGVDAGMAKGVMVSDLGSSSSSDPGFGTGFIIAYDFDRTLTGFTFQAGIRVNTLRIEGDTLSSASLYGALVWK